MAQAGAAGVLTGLVFVGVSINLQQIVSEPGSGLPGRAAEALILLVGVLTASVLLLVTGQGKVAVGAEVLAVGLAAWGGVAAIQLRRLGSWGTMRPDLRQAFVLRVALAQIATLPLVVAGIAVLVGGLGVYTGWWRAWSSRSWRLCSRRGCCSSRSTGRRRARSFSPPRAPERAEGIFPGARENLGGRGRAGLASPAKMVGNVW